MGRTKLFFYNSLFQIFSQIVLLLSGIIVPNVLLHTYGSEVNGLVTSIAQFISYFSLVEAGISGAAVYSLYKPLAVKDNQSISSIASAARKFYRQSGLFFMIMTVSFAIIYPWFINIPSLSYWEICALILTLGVGGALEFFAQGQYKVLLTAGQCMYAISITNIVYYFLYTAIVIVMAKLGASILLLRIVAILALIARPIMLAIFCHHIYPNVDYSAKPAEGALDKRWDALILQILGVIQSGAPVIILTLVARDLKTVSVYSVYNLVVAGVGSVAGVFTNGLSASFGDVLAKGEKNVLQRAYSEFEYAYYCFLTILYSVTVIMMIPFVRIYTSGITDAEYILPLVSVLITLQSFLHNLKTPQGMLVISAGLYKETRVQSAIQAGLVIVIGCALTPMFGIMGVLLGLLVSEIYRLIDLMFYIPKNVTGLSVKITAKRIIAMLIVFLVAVLVSIEWNVQISSYITWAVYAVIVTVSVSLLVIALAYFMDKNEFKYVLNRIKRIVGKNK